MIGSQISKKASDYILNKEEYFYISEIDKDFLKRHKINMTIKQFKNFVRTCTPYDTVLTGGFRHEMRATKLYKMSEIKKKIAYLI